MLERVLKSPQAERDAARAKGLQQAAAASSPSGSVLEA